MQSCCATLTMAELLTRRWSTTYACIVLGYNAQLVAFLVLTEHDHEAEPSCNPVPS